MKAKIDGIDFSELAEKKAILDPEVRDIRDSLKQLFTRNCKSDSYRGPATSVLQFNQFVDLAQKHRVKLPGKKVIDFGCGESRPLGGAIMHYLSGAESVLSLDLTEMRDQGAVAVSAAATIISVLFGELSFKYK